MTVSKSEHRTMTDAELSADAEHAGQLSLDSDELAGQLRLENAK